MKGMILAAGYGRRFLPQTLHLAKPALPLFDLPMIAHPIHYLALMGVKEYIINTHYLPQTVEKAVQKLNLSQKNHSQRMDSQETHSQKAYSEIISSKEMHFEKIHWSFEKKILGSGGGIKKAQTWLGSEDYFIVANADCVLSLPSGSVLSRLVEEHKHNANAPLATLLSCPHPGLGTTYGALWCKDNQVKKIGKASPSTYPKLIPRHYASIMLLSQKIFEYLPEGSSCIFKDAICNGISQGELVQSLYFEDMQWFETGDLDSYLKTQKKLLVRMQGGHDHGHSLQHPHGEFLKSVYRRFLDYEPPIPINPTTSTPATTGSSCLHWISPHAVVFPGTKVGENVVICSGAQVGSEISSKNAEISLENATISWGRTGAFKNNFIHSMLIL